MKVKELIGQLKLDIIRLYRYGTTNPSKEQILRKILEDGAKEGRKILKWWMPMISNNTK